MMIWPGELVVLTSLALNAFQKPRYPVLVPGGLLVPDDPPDDPVDPEPDALVEEELRLLAGAFARPGTELMNV